MLYSYSQFALSTKVIYIRNKSLYAQSRTCTHKSYMYAISRLHAKYVFCTISCLQGEKAIQPMYADRYSRLQQINKKYIKRNLSVMACSEQSKSTQVNHDWTKERNVTERISLEDLMERRCSHPQRTGPFVSCQCSLIQHIRIQLRSSKISLSWIVLNI